MVMRKWFSHDAESIIFRLKFLLIVIINLEMSFLVSSIFTYWELEIKKTGEMGKEKAL